MQLQGLEMLLGSSPSFLQQTGVNQASNTGCLANLADGLLCKPTSGPQNILVQIAISKH